MRQQRFDLVLLDVLMPELDGYAVLEELQRDPHLRDIPVVVTSALDELDSVVRCLQMGAEDYLTKPAARQTHELAHLTADRRPARLAMRIRPTASHEPPLPAQQRLRLHQERVPLAAADRGLHLVADGARPLFMAAPAAQVVALGQGGR